MINVNHLRDIYRMNNVIRYNTWHKVKEETVASHSYFVSLFTMMLCEKMKVSDSIKLKAIQIALIHDTPEIVINDITYDAKQLMPEINEILEKYEKEFIHKNFPSVYETMYESNSYEDHLARDIVKLADIYSVYQYCDNEVLLGNERFEELLDGSIERLEKAIKQIGGNKNA